MYRDRVRRSNSPTVSSLRIEVPGDFRNSRQPASSPMRSPRSILLLGASIPILISARTGARRGPESPSATFRVVTDSARYTLAGPGLQARAWVSAINPTADTVFLAPCGNGIATEVQRLWRSKWWRVDRGICATVRAEPTPIAPGATERFPVHLGGGPGMKPSAMVGTLRIVVHASAVQVDAQGRRVEIELPLAGRATAPFRVRMIEAARR